jgi:hypothetical protein
MSFSIPPHLRGKTSAERADRVNRAAILAGVASWALHEYVERAEMDPDALSVASGRAVIRSKWPAGREQVYPLRDYLKARLGAEDFARIDTKGSATAAIRQNVRERVPDVGSPVEVPEVDDELKARGAARRVVEAMRDGRRTVLPDPPPRPDAPPPLPGV